jgi:hypothetical protein
MNYNKSVDKSHKHVQAIKQRGMGEVVDQLESPSLRRPQDAVRLPTVDAGAMRSKGA